MARTLAFDVTRLFTGPLSATPRGIDRVEMAYMHHVFETWPDECVGILPTPWGVRTYERRRILRGLAVIETLWREQGRQRPDTLFGAIRSWLVDGPEAARVVAEPPRRRQARPVKGFADLLRSTGFAFGASAKTHLPRGSLYLNIGQTSLLFPIATQWLATRRDIIAVFMLHDTIPLEVPDMVPPNLHGYQTNMIAATNRYASGLIVTTKAAEASIKQFIAPERYDRLRVARVHLPLAPAFQRRLEPDMALAARPYFVVCGAIETRKNQALLFRVWSHLAAKLGAATPRLVVVGAVGWGGAAIIADLAARKALADLVFVASGLPTGDLAVLITNARALLSPSLAEGFGLPVAEALALETPVLASSIAAHEEITQGCATLLDPSDEDAWETAIVSLSDEERFASAKRQSAAFKATTTEAYFKTIIPFLNAF